MKYLYLDDIRTPKKGNWTIVRNYNSFVKYIEINGLPDFISFDHDLGLGKDGYDCAKWLIEYCLDREIPPPKCSVHSANLVGAENIRQLLINYNKYISGLFNR